jgi:hypothetical protein
LKSVEQGGLPGAVQPQDEDPHLAAAEQVLEVTEQSAHLYRGNKFASDRFLKKKIAATIFVDSWQTPSSTSSKIRTFAEL